MDFTQKLSKDSLFSALISKTTTGDDGIDLNLDMPDLPENADFLKWQIPTSPDYEWLNVRLLVQDKKLKQTSPYDYYKTPISKYLAADDEGFHSIKTSPNESHQNSEKNLALDGWENSLKFKFSDYVDWDMRKKYLKNR